MTSTDNPYRALELTQLVDDLGRSGFAAPYTRAGLEMLAETLYERGVRSRMHAPYRDDQLIQVTWDPAIEGFEITETGIYELIMEAIDVPDIEPFPTFPRVELPRMLHRLRRKTGLRPVLTQMSEAPEHVACPRCRPGNLCRYHTGSRACDGAELQVPGPIPERTLPEGVYNVIHFAQTRRAIEPNRDVCASAAFQGGPIRQLRVSDLETLLAEVAHLRTLDDTLAADFDAIAVIDEHGNTVPCGTCSAFDPPVTKPAVGRTTAGWPRCAPHLVEDELVAAGHSADVKTCPSCHHLTSSHFEDGSGCAVTVSVVGPGADSNCSCTLDARSEHHE